ncbi:DUF58 domain-containing protein [Solidesulfovibrio sp.]|uniref:DUF58 domain-containing protein n=1 Tax=Solidesulfovibrio sp. TaxID=2910990 RepID=UPI0026290C86|nr:DUF58 domain-containing protein [Solidesulfovibrio sp.]
MQAWQLLAAARRVRLGGDFAARDGLAGGYRSAYRGTGLEYEESREYVPGDDVAAMDWKVTARLGRPYVKRFREERSRTVMLAVDVSPSMGVSRPGGGDAAFCAALAAVVLAVSAAHSRDRVGLVLFSDRVEAFLPPGKGPGQAEAVAAALAGARPAGQGTDPGPAFALVAATLSHRCLVFVFSDFARADFVTPLGRLAARHEVAAGLVGWGQGAPLPTRGMVEYVEAETGRRAVCDFADPAARARFAAAREEGRCRIEAGLRAAGVGLVPLDPAGHPALALDAYFRARRRPGRAMPPARAAGAGHG